MSDTITVQTKNVDVAIKAKAEEVVRRAGFSSLQDVLRVIIVDIANEKIELQLQLNYPKSPRLEKALEDFKSNRVKKIPRDQSLSESLEIDNV